MNRKSQVTVFMVIGMVMLVTVGFFMFLALDTKNGEPVPRVYSDVPAPLKMYLENLLDNALRGAAVEAIGPQGGYRTVVGEENDEPKIFQGPLHGDIPLEMNHDYEPVRYQTLSQWPYPTYPYSFPEDAPPHAVPYYYVLGDFNIPSPDRIHEGLLAETIERFAAQLNLSFFEEQYYGMVIPSEYHINVSVNVDDISAELIYPIEILTEDQHALLSNISIIVPIRLNRTYQLALCLVDRVVFDEGQDTTDPYDEEPDGDALDECKQRLNLDDYFTTRIDSVMIGGDFKGRFVAINDTQFQDDTGISFEFQYLIWKCSGNFDEDYPEQDMRVCEYACAKGIPEAVPLGICEVESRCNHFTCDPPVVKSADDDDKPAQGIMGVLKTYCLGDQSFIDGHERNTRDLEDNIECGMDTILGKRGGWPATNNRYCCPSDLGGSGSAYGIGAAEHICCLDPGHPCCETPEDMCCGFYEGDDIFDQPNSVRCPPRICDHDGDPQTDPEKDPICGRFWANECCDPSLTAGQLGGRSRGGCCDPSYALPQNPLGVAYGDSLTAVRPHPRDGTEWKPLTKDGTYDSWDMVIRGYYGWLCGDPTGSAGITNRDVQNYVELVHKSIKDGHAFPRTVSNCAPPEYFTSRRYPADPQYSICHSKNRPGDEISSTPLDLPWGDTSTYVGVMGDPFGFGINTAGCCCLPGQTDCAEYRLLT